MVGIAQLVERRIVVPDAEGSSPFTHPTLIKNGVRTSFLVDGIWCNGNTSDFDSGIVGSSPAIPAIFINDSVAQSAEHLPFKQRVEGSNPS